MPSPQTTAKTSAAREWRSRKGGRIETGSAALAKALEGVLSEVSHRSFRFRGYYPPGSCARHERGNLRSMRAAGLCLTDGANAYLPGCGASPTAGKLDPRPGSLLHRRGCPVCGWILSFSRDGIHVGRSTRFGGRKSSFIHGGSSEPTRWRSFATVDQASRRRTKLRERRTKLRPPRTKLGEWRTELHTRDESNDWVRQGGPREPRRACRGKNARRSVSPTFAHRVQSAPCVARWPWHG